MKVVGVKLAVPGKAHMMKEPFRKEEQGATKVSVWTATASAMVLPLENQRQWFR